MYDLVQINLTNIQFNSSLFVWRFSRQIFAKQLYRKLSLYNIFSNIFTNIPFQSEILYSIVENQFKIIFKGKIKKVCDLVQLNLTNIPFQPEILHNMEDNYHFKY